ncbi:SHOCT domain-containing protein [Oceaniglobus roseus]|uniref:SHOCT domain-containing protein n=1 Tax=Oceaniglobus roseus TaxID=1737570 RepID=UPI000C7F1082|nr:SHOCT domain-containing protein [Kandeliimicrobium roseum]
MSTLTPEGKRLVEETAARHGFGPEAVTAMLEALYRGGGTQAQFDHPEFGGMGQWSQGGMTMVGDMFNNALKARVDALCSDLSQGLSGALAFAPGRGQTQSQGHSSGKHYQSQGSGASGQSSLFVHDPGSCWPEDLGQPASEGSQNDMRYAYFPEKRRLAVSVNGRLTIYDSGDHRIGGFGQAQGGGQSLSFTSQHGLVRLSELPVVPHDTGDAPPPHDAMQGAAMPGKVPERVAEAPQPDPQGAAATPATPPEPPASSAHGALSDDQIFSRIERLADLRDRGILSDEEFSAKKAELLSRL